MEKINKKNFFKFFLKKKILVTGATGFKGAWLCLWLSLLGAKVTACGMKKNSQKLFFNFKLENKIKTYFFDINNYPDFEKVIKKSKPEIIFHLAAQPLVIKSYLDPLNTFKTNILGSLNLLEIVRRNKFVKSLIIITTDKVYKNNDKIKLFKETDEIGGNDPYSASKASVELIIKSYKKSFYCNNYVGVASCRAGNVIGGGDFSKNRLIPDIINSLLKNKKIILRNPNFIRPWQHVLEPIIGYMMLAKLTYKYPKLYSGEYNFGPNISSCKKVRELVQKSIEIWGNGEFINNNKNNKKFNEHKNLFLSILKAKKILKWKPILNFNESIKITIEWYKEVYLNNASPYKISKKQIKFFQKKYLKST